MNQVNEHLSTIQITPKLVEQLLGFIKDKGWGSVEIYIENYHIVQITERTITKVNNNVGRIYNAKNGKTA